MPRPFHHISVDQFEDLVREFNWKRSITAVHMHHTWQPNHAQYVGEASIEAMRNYHVNQNGWSDIAQHISIAPDGTIWTGRGWNTPPASSLGHNGGSQAGPFMFEIIGNFDAGKDTFGGDQKAAVISVIVSLLEHFNLPISALCFHNQLGSPKTCPGNSINYAAFSAEVETYRGSRSSRSTRSAKRPSRSGTDTLAEVALALGRTLDGWQTDVSDNCCPDHLVTSRGAEKRSWTPADREKLARHVINLRNGQFIASGDYNTTEGDVRRLFEVHLAAALNEAKANGRPLRILFWAHGGLSGEQETLQHVLTYHQGWLNAGVYPIYFIWETDHGTALHDIFLGAPRPRNLFTDITDAGLEFTLQSVGKPLWDKMKEYAENSVKPKGGALFAAKQLASFTKAASSAVELYAMGHSAGSIFHSWFLPAALKEGVAGFKDLFLLAPAINVADFKARLIKHIGLGSGINHCSMFTMTEEAEREDTVVSIYKKSLLYFVSRACEKENNTAILGLQEDVYRDPELRSLFGEESTSGQVFWSPNGKTTNSTTHGGFDNDIATLHSMVKLMTGSVATPFAGLASRKLADQEAGRRVALCVGIDKYKTKPLSGCVNDARQWQATLQALDFQTSLLTNEEATYAGLVAALRSLIQGSRPGDQLVFQYAGHGTHVDDVNGDEKNEENPADDQDEALVPFDYDSGQFLIDDDIGDIMDTLPAGVSMTCFMDCCHSGSNTRRFLGFGNISTTAEGEVSRYIHVPVEIMAKHVALRQLQPPKLQRRSYQGKPEILFAACSPSQEAKERGGHGYFTITAAPLLSQAAGKMTHAQFLKAVLSAFPKTVHDQDPQLDCSEDRLENLMFGITSARESGAATAPLLPPEATTPQKDTAGAPPFDIEKLNDTMHSFVKLLERYSTCSANVRSASRGTDPIMDKVLAAIDATTGNAIITPETTLSSIGISPSKYDALIKHLTEQFPGLQLGGKQLKQLLTAAGGDTVRNLRNVIAKLGA